MWTFRAEASFDDGNTYGVGRTGRSSVPSKLDDWRMVGESLCQIAVLATLTKASGEAFCRCIRSHGLMLRTKDDVSVADSCELGALNTAQLIPYIILPRHWLGCSVAVTARLKSLNKKELQYNFGKSFRSSGPIPRTRVSRLICHTISIRLAVPFQSRPLTAELFSMTNQIPSFSSTEHLDVEIRILHHSPPLTSPAHFIHSISSVLWSYTKTI